MNILKLNKVEVHFKRDFCSGYTERKLADELFINTDQVIFVVRSKHENKECLKYHLIGNIVIISFDTNLSHG